jgi:hypothetical protein
MRRTLLGIFAGLVIGVSMTAGVSMVRGQSNDGGVAFVPDVEKIYKNALANVFDAAGEKFTDPELKEFYDRLTGEITDSLETPVPFDPGITELTPTPTPEPKADPTAIPTPEPTAAPGIVAVPTATAVH